MSLTLKRCIVRNRKDRKKHFKKRLWQRYRISAIKKDVTEIKRLIQSGAAQFVSQRTDDTAVYDVNYAGQMIRVVYNSCNTQLVTALPREDVSTDSISDAAG